jgi:hypothetical protein
MFTLINTIIIIINLIQWLYLRNLSIIYSFDIQADLCKKNKRYFRKNHIKRIELNKIDYIRALKKKTNDGEIYQLFLAFYDNRNIKLVEGTRSLILDISHILSWFLNLKVKYLIKGSSIEWN